MHQRSKHLTLVLGFVLLIHVTRLFIDLRRLPILVVLAGFLMVMVVIRRQIINILSRHLRLGLAASIAGAMIVAWPVLLLLNRLAQRNLFRGLFVRLDVSRQALQELHRNPVIGRGYIAEFKPSYEVIVQGHVRSIDTVHNLYVYVLANAGIIGFVLFGLILVSVFRLSIRGVQKQMTAPDRILFSAAFGTFSSMLVFFVFSVRGHQTDTMLIFSVITSVLAFYSINSS
ncbi:O-antigen ligase family protein [Saliphagus sp. GCM10025317]